MVYSNAYFCILYNSPNQNLFLKFKDNQYDPRFCIKKIHEIDIYLSYIAYAEYNYIINPNFRYDVVLSELIFKYKNRFEAYLKYWNLLVRKDSKYKNFKKAHYISEIFGNYLQQ